MLKCVNFMIQCLFCNISLADAACASVDLNKQWYSCIQHIVVTVLLLRHENSVFDGRHLNRHLKSKIQVPIYFSVTQNRWLSWSTTGIRLITFTIKKWKRFKIQTQRIQIFIINKFTIFPYIIDEYCQTNFFAIWELKWNFFVSWFFKSNSKMKVDCFQLNVKCVCFKQNIHQLKYWRCFIIIK